MKIEFLNTANLPTNTRKKESSISFNTKGVISINAGIVETLQLDEQKTWYLQLGKTEVDCYIMINEDPKGFALRPKGGMVSIKSGFLANATALLKKFYACQNLDLDTNYKFDVSTNPVIEDGQKLLAIFLSSKKEMTK